MTGFAPLDIAFLGGLMLLGAVLLRRVSGSTEVRTAREWRWVRATRILGLVGGVLAVWYVLEPWRFGVLEIERLGGFGMGVMLAPAAFGLVVVIAVAIGETVIRPARPTGRRTASLRPRRLGDYLPRKTTGAVTATTLALGATLLFTTATASPDTSFGGMRVLSCTGAGVVAERSPYPGSYYSAPLTAVLAVVLLVAALAAYRVIRRPRGLGESDADDDALRRRSLNVVVAATGIAVSLSHVGIALTAATALVGLDACAPGWAAPAGWVIGLSAIPALLVGMWCLVRVISNDTLERT